MFVSLLLGLAWRLADIQVIDPDFLRNQGDARHVRQVPIAAHRGMILDRHGEPLAVSTPVHGSRQLAFGEQGGNRSCAERA
jgi:cell division protein FtsI (penicillin-binding protein 3)